MAFRQGGSQRLAALHTKSADVVVLSSLAVPRLDRSRVSWTVLPDYTFYRRAAVVVLTADEAPPRQGCRVAIDRHSFDHVAMTNAEFPDARLVDADYVRIPELVASGQVDAAVWHQTGVAPLLAAKRVVVHRRRRPTPHPTRRAPAHAWCTVVTTRPSPNCWQPSSRAGASPPSSAPCSEAS